ncbi:hypothetical protein DAKH74_047120 [Maudiozyma humilis]|uniref:Zn(2)-C6 fungal-type domain-containing protein n=1 Tax=Maudiozyma humilis TaxID=51915 RepID=A0AAV5S2Z9_MAUHU|nr:hypothetical protein DAKH74_047120 [Kazachstania humilis]
MSEGRVSKHKKKITRVSKACNTCRTRKIKCNGVKPCVSCVQAGLECDFEDNGVAKPSLFKEEDDIRKDLRTLTTCVNTLTKLNSINPQKLNPVVNELNSKLNEFRNDLRVMLEKNKIRSYDSQLSIETEIPDANPIRFNRFNYVNTEDEDVKPVINPYFGMYSPLILITHQGFAWMFRKLFMSNISQPEVKTTFYLYLKFFDLSTYCTVYSRKYNVAPLESYRDEFMDKDVACTSQEIVNHIFASLAHSLAIPEGTIPEMKPDDSVGILQQLNEIAPVLAASADTEGLSATQLQETFKTCQCIDVLFTAARHNIFRLKSKDLDIIDPLLTYLEKVHSTQENYAVRDLVGLAVDIANFHNLGRWEHYVGMDEETADFHRRLWYRCLVWDRWAAVITGAPFLIDETMNLCLLPKSLMALGLTETMDCAMLLDTIHFSEISDDQTFVDAANLILAALITRYFRSILFNHQFTDYRVLSNKYSSFESNLHDLLNEIEQVTGMFSDLDAKVKPYINDFSYNNPRFETYMNMQYCRVEMYNTIESVLTRFSNSPRAHDKNLINQLILKHRYDVFTLSANGLRMLSGARSFISNMKCIRLTTMFFMHLILYSIDNPAFKMVDEIATICRIIINERACSQSSERVHHDDGTEEIDVMREGANLPLYFAYVFARIFLEIYIDKRHITADYLIGEVSKIDEQSGQMCRDILDVNSPCYEVLLSDNIPMYAQRKKVLEDVNKMTQSRFMDDFTPPPSGGSSMSQSQRTDSQTIVNEPPQLTTLDDFLQLDAFNEIYEALWGDLLDSPPEGTF